jgi:4-diphosphocytidyl-2C-methyl-D-erythritol kinase
VEPLKLERVNKYLLLLYPEIIVNTRNAYALFDKKKLTKSGSVNINSVRQTGTGALKDWTKSIFNDFEDVVFEEYPLLADVRKSLNAEWRREGFYVRKRFFSDRNIRH